MPSPEGSDNQAAPQAQTELGRIGDGTETTPTGPGTGLDSAIRDTWGPPGGTSIKDDSGPPKADKTPATEDPQRTKPGMRPATDEEKAALNEKLGRITAGTTDQTRDLSGQHRESQAQQAARERSENGNGLKPLSPEQKEAVSKLFKEYLNLPFDAEPKQVMEALKGLPSGKLKDFNNEMAKIAGR